MTTQPTGTPLPTLCVNCIYMDNTSKPGQPPIGGSTPLGLCRRYPSVVIVTKQTDYCGEFISK